MVSVSEVSAEHSLTLLQANSGNFTQLGANS